MTLRLVGASEAAGILAVTRQRLAQLAVTYDDFPPPQAELACGRIWLTEAIEAWRDEHLFRPSGPRKRRLEAGVYACFSDPLKVALATAGDEAKTLDHNLVGTPHLLLGLMSEPVPPVLMAAEAVQLEVPALRQATADVYDQQKRSSDGKYPFTPRAKEALDRALRVAFLCQDSQVRPEHLLFGIAELTDPPTIQVLTSIGTSPEALGDAVLDQLDRELVR